MFAYLNEFYEKNSLKQQIRNTISFNWNEDVRKKEADDIFQKKKKKGFPPLYISSVRCPNCLIPRDRDFDGIQKKGERKRDAGDIRASERETRKLSFRRVSVAGGGYRRIERGRGKLLISTPKHWKAISALSISYSKKKKKKKSGSHLRKAKSHSHKCALALPTWRERVSPSRLYIYLCLSISLRKRTSFPGQLYAGELPCV